MKRALISGVGGQDGSYLAEYLLELGNYEVHGTLRLTDASYNQNLKNVVGRMDFHYADLRDEVSLEKVIRRVHPDEIYNLAAQSFVPPSWTQPAETFDVNAGGLARIFKICEKVCPKVRIYQASTSEMYGNIMFRRRETGVSPIARIDENVPMYPVSPYGAAKYAAHKLVDVYRQKGMWVVAGILFNHESPRRGSEMVTRKISRHIARWMVGDMTELRLGDPNSRRDWGFAGDYVRAMHLMLQLPEPKDFVIGTGEAHSVSEFVAHAIAAAAELQGSKQPLWMDPPIVFNAPEFTRPAELNCLVADYALAAVMMGWKPQTTFLQLVKTMVEHDYKLAQKTMELV